MNSFFRSLKSAFLALGVVAALAFTGMASAQVAATTQTPCTGCVTPTPTPTFAPALSFEAWQYSNGAAAGQNAGGDGTGTVQTFAMNDTLMTLTGRLAANTQGACEVDCNLTLSTMEINSQIGTGALATNKGVGNGPVSSMVESQGFGSGSVRMRNVYVPVPSAP